uniref:MGAT4 conserved region domain-containing protein n=1 Tax=Spongospora subterranea TaxID=70186 RepID=A0A0H5R6V4_9EUKA|eukprot:CRZ04029.1 hypothetical protein [Spongospora subterranea]
MLLATTLDADNHERQQGYTTFLRSRIMKIMFLFLFVAITTIITNLYLDIEQFRNAFSFDKAYQNAADHDQTLDSLEQGADIASQILQEIGQKQAENSNSELVLHTRNRRSKALNESDPADLLIGVMVERDMDRFHETIRSILQQHTSDALLLRIMIYIPNLLQEIASYIDQKYRPEIASGMIFVVIGPVEESHPEGDDVKQPAQQQQRSLDFAYIAQVAANTSRFFLPLSSGTTVIASGFAHSIHERVSNTVERWSRITFVPEETSTHPGRAPFSGNLFNSTELIRIAIAVKTFRLRHPVEFIVNVVCERLMIGSMVQNQSNLNLFNSSRIAPGNYDSVLPNSGTIFPYVDPNWGNIPGSPPTSDGPKHLFTFGVPTGRRQNNVVYVVPLLHDLLTKISDASSDSIVIVMVTTPGEWGEQFQQSLSTEFADAISRNKLEVHLAAFDTYPPLVGLRQNYGDDEKRVVWRSKQNLDYSHLLKVANGRSKYFVMMEDDVALVADFVSLLQLFTTTTYSAWAMLDVCKLVGFAGKIFHDRSIWGLQVLLWTFYDELPCDWLVHVANTLDTDIVEVHPYNLLEHKGTISSFEGKNNITDKT